MLKILAFSASISLLLPAAVTAQSDPNNGWAIYYGGYPRQITCDHRPVLLSGSHTDLTLSGPCWYVRLTGAHNDVVLTVVPGGTIEITGEHNDVFWHPIDPAAAQPILLDRGYSNTFHRRVGNEED
jgi:hypothetical protein